MRVFGNGDEQNTLMKQVEDQRLAGRVEFEGFVATDEMKAVYEGIEAFVLPTREDCFGLVILDTMCAGMPCLYQNMQMEPMIKQQVKVGSVMR